MQAARERANRLACPGEVFHHTRLMKTAVAVTLIVMGALLVMTPVLADFLYQRNVVAIMEKAGVTNVSLVGQLGETYRFGCWFTGSAMVGVAVLGSFFSRRHTDERTAGARTA
jgi:hypothetical protein